MEAKSALAYCQKKYLKSLNGLNVKKGKQINESFKLLDQEIKNLDPITQINLYSAATQLLDSLINEPNDSINPLDVFHIRCKSILGHKFNASYQLVLGIAVVGIACATLLTGGALCLGLGILSGLWQTPFAFMASLLAFELPAFAATALTSSISLGVAFAAGYSFFKEPTVVTAMNRCVEVIKESYLYDNSDTMVEDESVLSMHQ
ncbi:hypothetical protein [Legionella saoudiensis]|uniref:hypothetical protein n=1 Tax=Legionella saoudiensis TaxID=1750561 RepID=UPI00072FEEFA|nr:hypothetical protein [Legionella saoudiensis]